jgi:redox-sensing transcriptional repressor
MGANSDVPDIVIGRLPIYLRALTFLAADGQEITSSHELGQKLGISSAQIRKDLSHFGEFGKQGTGYNITYLHKQLQRILQVDREWEVALIGAGDLGRALVHYGGFPERGFRVTAIFDSDPAKQGQKLGECVVQDSSRMAQVLKEHGYKIAMIAVPAVAAQEVADTCVEAGVKAQRTEGGIPARDATLKLLVDQPAPYYVIGSCISHISETAAANPSATGTKRSSSLPSL